MYFSLLPSALLIVCLQEPLLINGSAASTIAPTHKLVALHKSAHGVHDVNTVVWCPREGFEDLLATSGDDGTARVWRITSS
jgi:cytosolic iron-sulfur protein assembly protein CIAO1